MSGFAPDAGDPAAKAILIFRQSLDPDSSYADAAIHADGHITLQFRRTAGGQTEDRNSPRHGATRLHIVRRGDQFSLYAGPEVTHMEPDPSPVIIVLHDPVYVGIGVCAHNADHLETATFSNVKLERKPNPASAPLAPWRDQLRPSATGFPICPPLPNFSRVCLA